MGNSCFVNKPDIISVLLLFLLFLCNILFNDNNFHRDLLGILHFPERVIFDVIFVFITIYLRIILNILVIRVVLSACF